MRNGSKAKSGKPKTTPDEPTTFEMGSGNVFADLGLPNPELALAKAALVLRIQCLIDAQKLTQTKAADLLGIDAPKLALLLRGRTERYTLDRLFRFLNALGQRVEIAVRPNTNGARAVAVT